MAIGDSLSKIWAGDKSPGRPALSSERDAGHDVKRRKSKRDGTFKKNGWWWINYSDAGGKRHRRKVAKRLAHVASATSNKELGR